MKLNFNIEYEVAFTEEVEIEELIKKLQYELFNNASLIFVDVISKLQDGHKLESWKTNTTFVKKEEMETTTLNALKASIEKWKSIRDGNEIYAGPNNCPLCKLFYSDGDCIECPVRTHTGKRACADTPINEWEAWDIEQVVTLEEAALAQKEIDFLESLLPKED